MGYVVLGTDVETGQQVRLGDIERRSGLYLLGRMGMGKSALATNIAIDDIANGHGVFFLDPHGDAVIDLLRRGDAKKLKKLAYLLDIEDEDYSFGINLLACDNVKSRKARMDTYTRTYNVFNKLWEEEFGPWLQLILQNVLWAFIENQGYTLADVPMFLNHRNVDFRNHIVDNIKYNPAVADFWQYEFFERKEPEQQARVEAALTRINTLLTHPDVRDIVGQEKTTIDFGKLLSQNKIILLKLSANLPEDVKKFIGTILLSELVHAVRNRPEDKRSQFCVFIDEFHNFASTDHMAIMTNEGRKYGMAATYLHVERFGQLAHNQKLMGATQAIVNKVLFQATVNDAKEFAPEFAKEVTVTETRLEPEYVITPDPFWDLLKKSHANPKIAEYVYKYFWPIPGGIEEYRYRLELAKNNRTALMDQANLYRDYASMSQADEREEGRYNALIRGTHRPQMTGALDRTRSALESMQEVHGEAENQNKEIDSHSYTLKYFGTNINRFNRFFIKLMREEGFGKPDLLDFINTCLGIHLTCFNDSRIAVNW
jgi:hypothetical protein